MKEQEPYLTLVQPFFVAYRAYEMAMDAIRPTLTDAPIGEWHVMQIEAAVNAATDQQALDHLRADAPNAIPVLLEALKCPSESVRWCAGFVLKKLGPVAVPALAAALSDQHAGLREQAARVLGEMGAPARDAVPALVAALWDRWHDVRIRAAVALREIGPAAKDAVPMLKELVAENDLVVSSLAVEALAKIGGSEQDTVPALISMLLRVTNAPIRAKAAEMLGKIGPKAKDAVPALLEAMGDKNDRVSEWASVALGKIKAEGAVPDLVKALREGEDEVRWKAALVLGEIGVATGDAVPALTDALRASSAKVRWRAARALGKIGAAATDAVPALSEALRDTDDAVRSHAWAALGNIRAMAGEGAVPITPSEEELALEFEAREMIPQLKLFYLVFRVYREGKDSLRGASEALQKYRFHELSKDDVPGFSNVSLAGHIRNLESFFIERLKKDAVSLFCRPKAGAGLQFTDDAQNAWEWTDRFLRERLAGDWFGFYRLTPENKPERHSGG